MASAGGPRDGRQNPPGDWRAMHLWHIQPVRDAMVIAGVIGILYLGYTLSVVTVPILLAMGLAYLFEPLVRRLTRSGRMSRPGVAIGLVVLLIVAVLLPLAIGAGFAVIQGGRAAARLAENTTALVKAVQAPTAEARKELASDLPPGFWQGTADWVGEQREKVGLYRIGRAARDRAIDEGKSEAEARAAAEAALGGKPMPNVTPLQEELVIAAERAMEWVRDNAGAIAKSVGETAVGTGAGAVSFAARTLGSIGKFVFGAFLTAFFFYFFSTGYGRVLAFWESLIPDRKKGRAIELLSKMDRVISGFIRGRLLICCCLGAYITLAYWLIGVPMPLVIGPLVGLFFLVPFLHVLGTLIAIFAMWIEPSSVSWQQNWWWIVFAPIGVSMTCQILDDYILTPRIQGKTTEMAIPAILFASIAGGSLAGFYGLLVAIPVAACVRILLIEVVWPRFRAWAQGREADILPIGRE